MHTVADVFCLGCNERLGWYYMKASDSSQKYKEGEVYDSSISAARHNLLSTIREISAGEGETGEGQRVEIGRSRVIGCVTVVHPCIPEMHVSVDTQLRRFCDL